MLEELSEIHGLKYDLTCYERVRPPARSGLEDQFPLGKSPILKVYEDGKLSTKHFQIPQHPGTLTESKLIIEWLNENFAKGIYEPEDEKYKMQDNFFIEFATATMAFKVTTALIFEFIPQVLPWGLRHLLAALFVPIVNYWKNDQQPVFQLMEDSLNDESPWFSGPKMGLADFNMIWGMDNAWQRNYFDRKKYPKVAAWYKRIVTRPAHIRALEKGGSYNITTFAPGKVHPALDPNYKWD